jgi:DnaD/phage-associated family protein
MARRRLISSTIDRDEWFGELGFFERDFWRVLVTTCADDQGRILDNLTLIRSDAYPFKDVPLADIENALQLFEQSDWRIYRYEVDGKRYIQILNWWEHQPMQWASASKFPAPPGWTDHVRTREGNRFVEHNWGTQAERAAQGDAYREALRKAYSEANASHHSGPNSSAHGEASRHITCSLLPVTVPVTVTPGADAPETPPPPTDDFTSEAYRAYQNMIGLVSGAHQSQEIGDLLDELVSRGVLGWWQMALDEAVDHNKRSWAYVRSILRNWLARGSPSPRQNGQRASPPPEKRVVRVINPVTGEPEELEARI